MSTPVPKAPSSERPSPHLTWLKRAEAIALQQPNRGGSHHPTVKVGAILVDRKGREIARASNRLAYGVDHARKERYADGAKSFWINCAEQLVIANALRRRCNTKGARLYLTLEPCAICAGLIGEARIKEVFVPHNAARRYAKLKTKWKSSIKIGLIKLAEAGVRLQRVNPQPLKKKRRFVKRN